MSGLRVAASRVALSGLAVAGLLVGVTSAHAGALSVTPVRIEVAPGGQFCSVSVSNDEDHPVSVQIRGYGWRQDAAGGEVLDAGGGLVINPEIVTLAARQTRLVRCSVPAPMPARQEEAWRLIVDEIPPPTYNPAVAIKAMLRLSIPVFRTPDAATVSLSGHRESGDFGPLLIRNTGTRHIKVLGLIATSDGQQQRFAQSFYLLAGSQRQIALPDSVTAGAGQFAVETVEGVIPITFDDPTGSHPPEPAR